MKRLMFFFIAALTAATPASAIKYVAVVESAIDAASGVSAEMTPAEVRLITAELRREAVKNLPRDRYNVMTAETVIAQGSAKLEECAEENCVITLGAKIGADFIVRGTISKFRTLFTLTIDIFETEDGNLIASSDPIRSENVRDLLENTAAACASMYKDFVNSQNSARKPPSTTATAAETPTTYTVTAAANPESGGYVIHTPDKTAYDAGEPLTLTAVPYAGYKFTGWSGASTSTKAVLKAPVDRDLTLTANFYKPEPKHKPKPAAPPPQRIAQETPEREPMTGFSLGYNFFPGGGGHSAVQLGVAHSRPLPGKTASFNFEGNIWAGGADYNDESYSVFSANVPATLSLQLSYLSLEAGVYGELLTGGGETLFNAGLAAGAGIGFSQKRSRRYFYRYSGGYNFGTHVIGMRWLF